MACNLQCSFFRISLTFQFNWFYINKQLKLLLTWNISHRFVRIQTFAFAQSRQKTSWSYLLDYYAAINLSHRFDKQLLIKWHSHELFQWDCTQCEQRYPSIGYLSNRAHADVCKCIPIVEQLLCMCFYQCFVNGKSVYLEMKRRIISC